MRILTKYITGLAIHRSTNGSGPKLAKKLYKCFECGKIYEDEESAAKCHNGPVQQILKQEGKKKPRFLGA